MRRLRQMQQAGGRPGGAGGPQLPRGSGAALLGGALLVGGAMFFNNALFNVDGGHRAIKYRRISGVSKDIYNEGKPPAVRFCNVSGPESIEEMSETQLLTAEQVLTSTSRGSRLPSSTTSAHAPATLPP